MSSSVQQKFFDTQAKTKRQIQPFIAMQGRLGTGSTAFTPSGQTPFTAMRQMRSAINGLSPDGVNAVLPVAKTHL